MNKLKLSRQDHLKLAEEQINANLEYKKEIAKRFIDYGYSVELTSNPEPKIEVYVPSRESLLELRALIRFVRNPKNRLENSLISELIIKVISEDINGIAHGWSSKVDIYLLFEYKNHRVLIDRLDKYAPARKLYDDIMQEFR